MILAAGLLVLLGLGLFVAGLASGTTVLYWATVGVCVIAAVLLVLSRRGPSAGRADADRRRPAEVEAAAATPRRSATTREQPATSGATAVGAAADAHEKSDEPSPAETAPAVPEAAESAAPQPVDVPTPAHAPPTVAAAVEKGEPPVEEVEVTDLLLVVDLKDDVYVIDEHPRYHLSVCPRLVGHETIPLPLDEARTDGFTPCGVCEPDRTMAQRERARRAG